MSLNFIDDIVSQTNETITESKRESKQDVIDNRKKTLEKLKITSQSSDIIVGKISGDQKLKLKKDLVLILEDMANTIYRVNVNDTDVRIRYIILDKDNIDTIADPLNKNILINELINNYSAKYKNVEKLNFDKLLYIIQRHNVISEVNRAYDPFTKNKINYELQFIDNKYIVNYYSSHISINLKSKEIIDTDIMKNILTEYTQVHFKKFFEILDCICACRFSTNRRQSWLYLVLPAGNGKSFFCGILEGIDVAAGVSHQELDAQPSPLEPSKITNKLVLNIDEFRKFSNNMLSYNTHLKCIPKRRMTEVVEVYFKIVYSANKSKSFLNGVDSQITDRVNIIEQSDSTKLEDRPYYKKYGNNLYMEVMQSITFMYIKNKLDSYIELGKKEANKRAEKHLLNFYDKYGSDKSTENINDIVLEQFIDDISDIATGKGANILRKYPDLDDLIWRDRIDHNKFYIQRADTVFNCLVNSITDDDLKSKAKYIKTGFKNIVAQDDQSTLKSEKKLLTIGAKELPLKGNKKVTVSILDTTKYKTLDERRMEKEIDKIGF